MKTAFETKNSYAVFLDINSYICRADLKLQRDY